MCGFLANFPSRVERHFSQTHLKLEAQHELLKVERAVENEGVKNEGVANEEMHDQGMNEPGTAEDVSIPAELEMPELTEELPAESIEAQWLSLKLRFKMSREEFLQVIRLAKREESQRLPVSRRKWEKLSEQAYHSIARQPFKTERHTIETEGVMKTFTVRYFSLWNFAKLVFSKRHHARLLGNWLERKSRDGHLRDFHDGELFSNTTLLDPRDLRLLLYYDDTSIVHFNSTESAGVVRAIPANYPHYVRTNPRLWWNLLAVPAKLLATTPIHQLTATVLKEFHEHVSKGETIWDEFRGQLFPLRGAVVGILGDLLGRNQLFGLPQSFSKLEHWCPLCWGSREQKTEHSPLRSTEETIERGKILESLGNNSLYKLLCKRWGMVGLSALFECGVRIESSVDDAMHTLLMGGLVRQWNAVFLGYYFTSELRATANQRCDVYPFSKSQEKLSGLATKLPGKARNKLSALAPLLLISKGLLPFSSPCECVVDELEADIRDNHGLPPLHSLGDHWFCFRLFIHAALLTLRRDHHLSDLEHLAEAWEEWRDLMLDLQYSSWFHVKEHLLINHAGLTIRRSGPMPFTWTFANERAHRDFKDIPTNNRDDIGQRMDHALKTFTVELDATNTPLLDGVNVTRKGKLVPIGHLLPLLSECLSHMDTLSLAANDSLIQLVSMFTFRGLTVTTNCFISLGDSFRAFSGLFQPESALARVVSIYEHAHKLFLLITLYKLSGEVDDGLDGTGFPLVVFANVPPLFIPASVATGEVNIVPLNLDFFVERNRTLQLKSRACWKDWERGSYQGRLVVVPI